MATGQKSQLFSRHQPGGVFTIVDEANFTTGDIWFVDSGQTSTGSDAVGYGRNPDMPFLTIDYAVGQCNANNGDYIIVMPGHAETVAAAAGLALDVAGITVKGLGSGSDQPTVTFTDALADMDVDAANVTVENIHFVAGEADVAAAIDVNADDFTVRNCRMTGDNGGLNAVIWVLGGATTTSDRITMEDCYVMDRDASNTHVIDLLGTPDGCIVRRNVMLCDCGTAAIGATAAATNVTIADNYISNAATDADSGIELHASSTGIVANNRIGIALAGDATTGVSADGCALLENYVVDTGDRQGVLDPAAT
jgi:hypothetical protein